MIKLFIIGDAKRLPRPREPSDRLRLKRREKAEGFRMLKPRQPSDSRPQ